MIKNSTLRYGLLSRVNHWMSALLVITLFAVGLWMVELDYYHAWYQTAPNLHRSFGVVLMALTLTRIIWYQFSPKPQSIKTHSRKEIILAKSVHYAMLFLLFMMFISGYLITTAKGDPLYVFDVFTLPATLTGINRLEDYAGEVHELTAFTLMFLVCLHVAGALKHHFYDKDSTLKRMLGIH